MSTDSLASTSSPRADARRLAEISQYDVLQQPQRRELVALADVAAQVTGVPMATINLVTDTHQHQIAAVGFEPSVCAREDSMCRITIEATGPVVVADASIDERFRDNPFVDGRIGDVRFYASYQLRTPGEVVIGTLCVFDTEPRTLTAGQERALTELADRVVDLLELELRTRQLERSNEQLAAFAGQVSHDLRKPLGAITMSLDLLAEQADAGEFPKKATWVLDRALGAAGRMQATIQSLLAYARLGGELAREPVDLGAVLAEVRQDLAGTLADGTLEAGELPTVQGDRAQLRAVLQNLLDNAVKFSRAGEPPRIEVRSARVEGRHRIEVVDHGRGVAEGERERVFQPLQRAHEDVEGHGIGLATVRRIVQAHGGSVGVGDTPGGGATFWFELPA